MSGDLEAVRFEFLSLLVSDRGRNAVRPLADYQALFPGHAACIAEEYALATSAGIPAETLIGNYRLIAEIGRGGQGTVYLAQDSRLPRTVALKVLADAGPFLEENAVRRFRREAEVLSRLDHPGICPVFEVGADGPHRFIAMKLLRGATLARLLGQGWGGAESRPGEATSTDDALAPSPSSGETLPEGAPWRRASAGGADDAARIVSACARALDFAHEAGVVHRDVKPGNIMIDHRGSPVILDFGLSRESDVSAPAWTRTGDVLGTPAYMAPEQVCGDRGQADRRTDVYALGAVLYEMLTLCRPHEAPTRDALYRAILDVEPVPPRRLAKDVSRDLETVVLTAMAKERNRRYQTAGAFADDLDRVHARKPILARPPSLPGRALRWSRRNPAAAALIVVLVAGGLALAALIATVAANAPAVRAQERAMRERRIEELLVAGFNELADGDGRRALDAFRSARGLDPGSVEALAGVLIAAARLRLPDPLPDLPEGATAHPALVRLRADALRASGSAAGSASDGPAALEPRDALSFFLEGERHVMEGHRQGGRSAWESAFEALDSAIRLAPHARALYHFELAHAASHLGDPARCRKAAAAVEALWSDHPWSDFYRGLALMDIDLEAGRKAWTRHLERHPRDPRALSNLGRCLSNAGLHEEARRRFEEAIGVAPELADLHHDLGFTLLRLERPVEAESSFARAVALSPGSPALRGDHAGSLTLLDRIDEALDEYVRCAALPGMDPFHQLRHARLLLEVGRATEALPLLENLPGEAFSENGARELFASVREAAARERETAGAVAALDGATGDGRERLRAMKLLARDGARLLGSPAASGGRRRAAVKTFLARCATPVLGGRAAPPPDGAPESETEAWARLLDVLEALRAEDL